jgi:hypothetical protein
MAAHNPLVDFRTPAGTGEHRYYLISGKDPDGSPLAAQENYVGIDAVSWFVNKASSWFTDRIAMGTLSITLAGGEEKYDLPLGLYDLSAGAQLAPIFDQPVLPERVYRGGTVGLRAVLTGIKRDTKIARLIKSTSSAALSVVGGMVHTATLAGPYRPLVTAGGTLIDGLQGILDTPDEKMRIFDPAGLEVNLRANQPPAPRRTCSSTAERP